MFCSKDNVNILTAQLLAFGVEDAIVCPGSRNAVIVHNLHICAQRAENNHPLRLHPVTDERSAAFVAIGLWIATRRPIVVCVTSGSALLNLLPGVCEAYYRHIPLILVSADRPAEWIGQLDGQTLPQPNALLPYAPCWNLRDDIPTDTLHTLCREALLSTGTHGGNPVHINVPLHEPLFDFSVLRLPDVAGFPDDHQPSVSSELSPELCIALRRAQHPALIIGQWEEAPIPAVATLQRLGWTIFAENISNHGIYRDTLPPEGIDLLVHVGGALVEKKLKLQLRAVPYLTIVRIDETNECPATFGHVEHKVTAHPVVVLQQIVQLLNADQCGTMTTCNSSSPQHCILDRTLPPELTLFLGNSTAVRWANAHLRLPVPTYCNRGVNGIEGSLSVAAGHSLRTTAPTLCVIGDLSFFYDANALWNQQLSGNLRILLINNNRGDIFFHLPHLDESPALPDYIAAAHDNHARGIALSYHCTYLSAHTANLQQDIKDLLSRLLDEPSERPVILEVNIQQP